MSALVTEPGTPHFCTQKVGASFRYPNQHADRMLGLHMRCSYCITFSVDGAIDVTARYLRSKRYAESRRRCTESELLYITEEITLVRRKDLGYTDKSRLKAEGARESEEPKSYVAQCVAADICKLQIRRSSDGNLSLLSDEVSDAAPEKSRRVERSTRPNEASG